MCACVCVQRTVVSSGLGWSSPKSYCENGPGIPGSLKGTELLGEDLGLSASPETLTHWVVGQ